MAHNKLFTSSLAQEEKTYSIYPAGTQEYTPLSLNQFIHDGIDAYLLSNKKRVRFELALCKELKEVSGEPNQLRRVFAQMVVCFAGATEEELPRVRFATRNLVIPAHQGISIARYEYLSPGTYVAMRAEIDDMGSNMRFQANSPGKGKSAFDPFVWSQICEVIQVYGGVVRDEDADCSSQSSAARTMEIILPALDS